MEERKPQSLNNLDVLNAINNLSIRFNKWFDIIENSICGLRHDVVGLKQDVSVVKTDGVSTKEDINDLANEVAVLHEDVDGLRLSAQRSDLAIGSLAHEIGVIKATMVTKDYLDTKMFQLRGDLMGYDKQADAKTDVLVDVLHTKKVLDSKSASNIKGLSPFKRKTITV